jgi:E3 ubiquitin-protein ligase TRIP12
MAPRSNAALAAVAAEALAACGDLHDEDDDEEERLDEEEDDILDEELEAAGNSTTSAEERLVNFEVADDGSRVNASTPDGTRIQTPVPGQSLAQRARISGQGLSAPPTPSAAYPSAAAGTSGTASTSTGAAPPAGRSYAAALKKAPEDWHLEFSMGGKPIDMESTIFGAVYQHEVRSGNTAGIRGVWQNVYTVNFRKVAGAPLQAREYSLAQHVCLYHTSLMLAYMLHRYSG